MAIKKATLTHGIGSDNEQVNISVTIGDYQHLTSSVLSLPNGSYKNGPFSNFSMGLGSELRGKTSILTVMITDTNPNTNNTSITVSLTNNSISKTYSQASEVDNGTVIYILTINH